MAEFGPDAHLWLTACTNRQGHMHEHGTSGMRVVRHFLVVERVMSRQNP
jgi:hypothetical protein